MNTLFLKTLMKIQALKNGEEGQGLVEYGLIIALIALALTASLTGLAGALKGIFTAISTDLAAAA